ncbi:MAG: hypothetical protein H6815_09595 [Phycisphaeraceae bacterium]|nr:hypothetical protein [Phycisphaerales bacterium]MCB9860691.1 hypothetical protein [Phycisphaeraceae bacterium]
MKTGTFVGFAVTGLVATVAVAQPFNQLKYDINEFEMNMYAGPNGTGAQYATITAGGGLNYTGSWVMTFDANTFLTNNQVRGNNLPLGFGPFMNAGTAILNDFTATLNFVNGAVVDGSFSVSADSLGGGSDVLVGSFANNGTSNLQGAPNGPYFVFGDVLSASFNDDGADSIYGQNVDISNFINNGNNFFGAFAEILVADNGTQADFDLLVIVPAPGTAMLSLAGAGLLAVRRRR